MSKLPILRHIITLYKKKVKSMQFHYIFRYIKWPEEWGQLINNFKRQYHWTHTNLGFWTKFRIIFWIFQVISYLTNTMKVKKITKWKSKHRDHVVSLDKNRIFFLLNVESFFFQFLTVVIVLSCDKLFVQMI